MFKTSAAGSWLPPAQQPTPRSSQVASHAARSPATPRPAGRSPRALPAVAAPVAAWAVRCPVRAQSVGAPGVAVAVTRRVKVGATVRFQVVSQVGDGFHGCGSVTEEARLLATLSNSWSETSDIHLVKSGCEYHAV